MCGGDKRKMVENSSLSENGHPSNDFNYIYKDLKHCACSWRICRTRVDPTHKNSQVSVFVTSLSVDSNNSKNESEIQ